MSREDKFDLYKTELNAVDLSLATIEKVFFENLKENLGPEIDPGWATRICDLYDSITYTKDLISFKTRQAKDMVLTNKERVALWRERQRQDPQKHEEYKRKERQRYQKKKEKGVVKSIKELGERAKRKQRRVWRKNQQSKRKRDNQIRQSLRSINTPPVSPEPFPANICEQANRTESMKKQGRKRVRRDRSKSYREVFRLRVTLREERKLKEKYKKRYQRLRKKRKGNALQKKVDDIIERKEVKKSLLLHEILLRRIKERYQKSKTHKEKAMISSLVCSYRLLKRNRLAEYARKKLGMTTHSFNHKTDNKPERRKSEKTSRIKRMVANFLERDDNTRLKAGKKSTITRLGEKRQVRLLCDDLQNLHAKFLAEQESKISYSLFCALKPFHILKPTAKERETCLCKVHENLKFKLEKCHQLKAISTSNIDRAISEITCNPENKACMYRECPNCKDKNLDIDLTEGQREIWWNTWKTRREERIKTVKGEQVSSTVSVTGKEKAFGTLQILSEELNKDVKRASRHIFNIRHQYRALRVLKSGLDDGEVMVHIDFSENYSCKYSEEIQSTHFGASQRQITLHTGVAYTSLETYSFCSVSDSLKHGPAAIWAHLHPIIQTLKRNFKSKTIHFVSDGPTTQYRNKLNFFLFATKVYDYGFTCASWNFLEAGHGKGAADGIGAVVKRTADSLVNVQGKDITCAKELIEGLASAHVNVHLYLIPEEDVDAVESTLPADLKPLQKTMQIHQLLTVKPGEVKHRVLSCFCQKLKCGCFEPVTTSFLVEDSTPPTSEPIAGGSNANSAPKLTKVQHVVANQLKSKFCVIRYDGKPYPGIIMDVDEEEEEVEVKVMHSVGVNRFFWPMMDDLLWYEKDDIVTLLDDPPKPVTKRHNEIKKDIWSLIEKELDV